MISTLLLPALLFSGDGTAANAAPTALLRATVDGYKELAAEYDAAITQWDAALDATEDRNARAELRRNQPSKAFWPRFEALSAGGDGQATLWLATHLKDKGLKASERGPLATGYFETLFSSHVEADWFGTAIAALIQEDKVEQTAKASFLRKAVDGAKAPASKAPAMFHLGQMLFEDETTKGEGEKLLQAVVAEFPKTVWGTLAKAMFVTAKGLEVGKLAPDFYGESIDGFGFNLSDYRGKVVLLDFYGFW
jgi:hypothetical protein